MDFVAELTPQDSEDVLVSALATYAVLFRRVTWTDPDAGFGEAYETGKRDLQARAKAEPFAVGQRRTALIESVIAEAQSAPLDEIPALLVAFPLRILEAVNRRADQLGDLTRGRRWLDRVVARSPSFAATGMPAMVR